MYVLLDFLKGHEQAARFGFVHIPHRYDEQKATRLLGRFIDRLLSESGRPGGRPYTRSRAKN
jgi:hypothetical protein